MIQEIAQIDVKQGMEADFEKGVAAAAHLFKRAKGCHGMRLARSVEKPRRYRLFIDWESVDDHNVGFRQSEDFKEWRGLVGHCFETPPEVEHTGDVLRGF